MISLKRNSKGELVRAPGLRSRNSSIYRPNQLDLFRISRSKFSDFLSCRRCFYLDRVKGIVSPSTPGWSLNETTDLLLKKEFDLCREKQIPHKIFSKFGLTNVVPYWHEDLEKWRDSLHHGLEHHIEDTNIILHGGGDDIWYSQNEGTLIVVDYKSQASHYTVKERNYLASVHHQGYKIQLDVYAYLLKKMGFDVSHTGYFYVCNGDRNAPEFNGRITFEETLVPYKWNVDWIDGKISEMIQVLNSTGLPEVNPSCENCAYASQRAIIETEN